MPEALVMLITGTRQGLGLALAEHYLATGAQVIGCSRQETALTHARYRHFRLDVSDEKAVKKMFGEIAREFGRLDILVNNAGVASMNHTLLTPLHTVQQMLATNVLGTFLFCREAARLMQKRRFGRIVNLATIATPLKLEGEAAYAASKAAVVSLTEVLARELAPFAITVNAVGPGPLEIGLTRAVPREKLDAVVRRQAIPRLAQPRDVTNVIDFFIRPESDFVTGHVLYLGGI